MTDRKRQPGAMRVISVVREREREKERKRERMTNRH